MRTLRLGRYLALIALVIALASCKTAELGVTNFDSITLSDDLVVGDDTTITGDLTVTGAVAGAITTDLNGADLIIDADADTILDEVSDDNIRLTSGAATGLWNVLLGNLKVGNGTPGVALDGEDAYVEGTLEVDGAAQFDGAVTFNADPSLGTASVNGTEIDNVTRYINVPLMDFIECDTDAGALIGFDTTADALPDFVNSATDGTGFVLRFDATGSSEDQNTSICSQVTIPGDYASGGAFRVRYVKSASTAATEVVNCAVSVNGGALEAAGTLTTSSTGGSGSCTPTIASLAANASLAFHMYITSDSTMNEAVDLAAVAFNYTATQ